MINLLRKIMPRKIILWYHKCWAMLGVILYGLPTRKMHIVGITGTNGKTTTANLIWAILNKAGKKTGLISTVNFRIGEIEWLNTTKMTTGGRLSMHKLLKRMLNTNCEYAVIEVSSHAISQSRIWAINFDTAIFTNLTHDHLDYHKDIEEYKITKGQLFSDTVLSKRYDNTPKRIIVNKDSRYYDYFNQFRGDENYSYCTRCKDGDIRAENIKLLPDSSAFTAITPKGKIDLKINLPGAFNIYNALAAIAYGISENISLKTIKDALEEFEGVQGRMERINEGQNFSVIVDYAHTPDAFSKIFEAAQNLTGPGGRIISVFGATGDRDKAKRPELGQIAAKYSKYCFLTLEDPGSENPLDIINEIEPGLKKIGKEENKDYFKIIDRRDAIKRAFETTREGDVVLLLAKGHETVMVLKNQKIPWDERQVAREELKKLLSRNEKKRK
jgi:UDP-N-acetylmuramoyl-L-alanyl-D-glutamate--2,6-diaminopimelate ligase